MYKIFNMALRKTYPQTHTSREDTRIIARELSRQEIGEVVVINQNTGEVVDIYSLGQNNYHAEE